MLDISLALHLLLLASVAILREIMITWGDKLSDTGTKIILFLWTLFTLAAVGFAVSSDISITVMH